MSITTVESDEDWSVLAWLWQAFRTDMSRITGGLPRADGRFTTRDLDQARGSADHVAYLWWETAEHGPAPSGFALVSGLTGGRRTLDDFWVAHALRRTGVGRRLALDVIARHPGPWTVAFQHDNVAAGGFWRRVADEAFGPGAWTETERAVPHKPDVPPDHWIETVSPTGLTHRRQSSWAV